MTEYFIVTINLVYSHETTTVQELESRGFTVSESRRFGDLQLFHNDSTIGWLFSRQADQIKFLLSRGALQGA